MPEAPPPTNDANARPLRQCSTADGTGHGHIDRSVNVRMVVLLLPGPVLVAM